MNKFVQILVATLAVTCCVECGSGKASLVEQMDKHVQSKTVSDEPLDAITKGLEFIVPLVDAPKKVSLLDKISGNTVQQGPNAETLHLYLIKIQDIIESTHNLGCEAGAIDDYFEINSNLYSLVNKEGKLQKAISKYVKKTYDACSRDFASVLELKDSEKLDNFIEVAVDKAPEICRGKSVKDNELWRFECASNLGAISYKKIGQIVLDVVKSKSDQAQLAQDTKASLLRSKVVRNLQGYINSVIIESCPKWHERQLFFKYDSRVIGVDKTIDLWTRFAKIAGIEKVDAIVKAKAREAVCDIVGFRDILDEVLHASYGKL